MPRKQEKVSPAPTPDKAREAVQGRTARVRFSFLLGREQQVAREMLLHSLLLTGLFPSHMSLCCCSVPPGAFNIDLTSESWVL